MEAPVPWGRKEAPWDIIGGMTDDRIAYQLAQRPVRVLCIPVENLLLDNATSEHLLVESRDAELKRPGHAPRSIKNGPGRAVYGYNWTGRYLGAFAGAMRGEATKDWFMPA